MPRTVTTFVIMPPEDINADVVAKRVYLEDCLASEFPGYRFEVMDLRKVHSVDPDEEVTFSNTFSAFPLMGATSDNEGGGFRIEEYPPAELIEAIVGFCASFDFEKARRAAA